MNQDNAKLIYTFKKFDSRLSINQRYYSNIQIINSLDSLHWKDILLRKIKVISIPTNKNLHGIQHKAKSFFLRILLLTTSNKLRYYNLLEILSPSKSQNTIFVTAPHVYSIYKTHLPHFHAIETLSRFPSWQIFLAYIVTAKTQPRDPTTGITVFTNPFSELLIHLYIKLHPKKEIILRFHDILTKSNSKLIKTIRKAHPSIKIESYSIRDASTFQLLYRPNAVNISLLKSLEVPIRNNLYSFSGSSSSVDSKIKNRLKPIHELNLQIEKIYPTISPWIETKITKTSDEYSPYLKFMKQSTMSEIYIDLVRINQDEGFSYRVAEAIALNRKIITNRTKIKSEIFYNPDLIYIIGHDSTDRLKSFLESPPPKIPEDILLRYDSRHWWTDSDPYHY